MHIPCTRERVEIAGRDGVFLVAAVDLGLGVAELVPLVGDACLIEIPFRDVRPWREEVPREAA